MLGWEQGLRIPRLDAVERVAYALGLSPAFLAYGIESDGSQPTEGLRCEGVASRLRQTRAARGLTMRALARAAGLTDTAVRSTETGTSMPSIATVEAFAIALGVSPGWLAYGLGPMELPGRRRVAASPAASPVKTARLSWSFQRRTETSPVPGLVESSCGCTSMSEDRH